MKTKEQTHNMPNNILVISEKLLRTKAPWKIENSYLGQLTKDHKVIIFDYDWNNTTFKKAAKQISLKLYDVCQTNYNHLTFASYGQDSKVLAELTKMGYKFDAAILINNPHEPSVFTPTLAHTSIYNFYNKKKLQNFSPEGAECSEYIKTIVPANLSNKIARQATACLVYQSYEQTHLSPIPAVFTQVSEIL